MGRLLRRIWYLVRWRRTEQDLRHEIALHRALVEERSPGSGARVMGNMTLAREDARAVWIPAWLDGLQQDLRYALRTLKRQPAFSVSVVLTLSVGIGLNTTVATMFSTALWRPWAATDGERFFQVLIAGSERGRGPSAEIRYDVYRQLQSTARLSTLMAAGCGVEARMESCAMRLDDERVVTGQFVSANFFRVVGGRMSIGRGFLDEEDRTVSQVAVISDILWHQKFGADPGVIGREVRLDDVPFTIVGVIEPGFAGVSLVRRDVWVPLSTARVMRPSSRPFSWVEVAGRVNDGVSKEQAAAEIASIGLAGPPGSRATLGRASFFPRPNDRSESYLFFAALFTSVLLVLLLSCANAGNLLLARTSARGREMSIRVSLGAGRGRLVRQLLTESLVLASVSAAIGFWIAYLLPTIVVDRALAASDARGALSLSLKPDAAVLAFTCALAMLTCIAFGLAPALHASRPDPAGALKDRGGRPTRLPLRATLLAVQVSISLILLIAAGLLVRGLRHAKDVDLGFRVHGIDVVSFEPPASATPERLANFARGLIDDAGRLGERTDVALATAAPLDEDLRWYFWQPGERPEAARRFSVTHVTRAYFELLGIQLSAGRALDPGDAVRDSILINEAMARRFWPGESALGRTLLTAWSSEPGAVKHVVGVVRDADTGGDALRMGTVGPRAYELMTGARFRGANERALPVILAGPGAVGVRESAIAVAARLDPRIRPTIASLPSGLDRRLTEGRFIAILAGSVGLAALALASFGVFGVFSYVVCQQTRDIGVRMALGARPLQVIRGVFAFGARPLLWGLAVGVGGSLLAGQVLRNNLFGLSPIDPVTYGFVIGIVTAAALVALAVPAWRATRIDPVIALRSE